MRDQVEARDPKLVYPIKDLSHLVKDWHAQW